MLIDYDLTEAKQSYYLFSKKDGQSEVLETIYEDLEYAMDCIEDDLDGAFGKSVDKELEDVVISPYSLDALAAWHYDTVTLFLTDYDHPYVRGFTEEEDDTVTVRVKY